MTKAILLAAGEGTRLRPVTETRPKSMIPVLCKPLLEWHLKALLRSGVETIYVVVSYM
ncbi:MAG: sugar phosphate nucleotidyltransferase, partial [Desulfurococcaceae archaeon]